MTRQHPARKTLLWAIPITLLAIVIAALLALPGFVASSYHRATIEALASSLTGRSVHIGGKLSLDLLPQPLLIADDITITGPSHEIITATSLTLDIAPSALLRGRLSARSITLQSPLIALPWPLPGGAAAIAPPPWLTALHAQINDGQVSLGAIVFTHVSADIFTGGDGALSVSGNGNLASIPVDLSLSFGGLSAVGSTPLTLDIKSTDATKIDAHVTGTFDSASTMAGNANLTATTLAPLFPDLDPTLNPWLAQPLTATASVTADPEQISLAGLNILQGAASLSGTATLTLPPDTTNAPTSLPMLALTFTAANLNLPADPKIPDPLAAGFSELPIHLVLDATNTRISGDPIAGKPGLNFSIPQLQTRLDLNASGAAIDSFDASFPGNAELSLQGSVNRSGNLQAKARFNAPELPLFFASFSRLELAPTWQEASFTASLNGNSNSLHLDQLTGKLGPERVTGTVVFNQPDSLGGQLHFDQLDLTPFATVLDRPATNLAAKLSSDLPASGSLSADFEITADQATLGKMPLNSLLLDANVGNQFVVRRLSAAGYGGLAAGSFTVSENSAGNSALPPSQTPAFQSPASQNPGSQITQITSARAIVSVPSAEAIALLLPANLQPPPAITKAPLSLSLLAAGAANSLATSAVLTLGDITITTAPTLDLAQQTAAGPFTLRHPSAIAAFKAFGLKSGLPWPGAGSISLRADIALGPNQIGFPDFVLSMGDLTANGRIMVSFALPPANSPPNAATQVQVQGQLDADTLALPPIPPNLTLPWAALASLQGKLDISANNVLLAGNPILGQASANIVVGPNKFTLTVDHASLGNGILAGDFAATTPAGGPAAAPTAKPAIAPPSITANFTVTGADASTLNLPIAFPITVPSGIANATAHLTATGYAPQTWLATLAGNASLVAKSGSIDGFNLPALSTALDATSHRTSQLRDACNTGATPFTSLTLNGNFQNGVYSLTTASLLSPAGTATGAGTIDLPNTGITLTLTLVPKVPAPPKLDITIAGSWTSPKKIADLKPALGWKPPSPAQ